jgi:hypothetical protein
MAVILLPPHLRKPASLLAAVALALLAVALAFRWWDRYVEDGLGRRAVDEVARRTGGAWRLVLSDPSFLPLAGSISLDSIVVTTDSVVNLRRAVPLPALEWRAHQCRVSGLDVPRLLLRQSFIARELGCRRVAAVIALVHPDSEERRPASDSAGSAARVPDPARPLGLSWFRIAGVSVPQFSLTLTRPGRRGGTSIRMEHARFEAGDLVFAPGADARKSRSLSAERARLMATGLVVRLDTLSEIAVAGLEADLAGSTLRLAGIRHEPPIPEDEWVRRLQARRNRIRFESDSLLARGVAWRAFVATGEIGVRALELKGPRLDVLSDRRLPRGRPKRHLTPQQVAAARGPAFRLDSLVVTRGTIVYRERRPGRDRPGRVSFDAVRGTILNLDLPSRGKPLSVAARARLMNEGLLTVEATVPLDAPDFRYRISGKLGSMPATLFNRFLSENEAYEFADGWVEGITFRQATNGGRAVTMMTPRYYDLSVQPTGEGGGLFGSVKRAVKKFVANAFQVRSRNPGEDGRDLRTVRTARRYDPADGWVHFLWVSLRDGLMEGIKE